MENVGFGFFLTILVDKRRRWVYYSHVAVMAQAVEHVLGKDEVTSSNLVNSSIIFPRESSRGILLSPAPFSIFRPIFKKSDFLKKTLDKSERVCYNTKAVSTKR